MRFSSDGSLWVWGDNGYGQLGLGVSGGTHSTPQHLLPPAGYMFTSIDVDGAGTHAVATLATVPEPASCLLLAIGGFASAAMRQRRTIKPARHRSWLCPVLVVAMFVINPARSSWADSAVAWGPNGYGQVGDGTTATRSSPVAVIGMSSDVSAVAEGGLHSLAVQNGAVYAWGDNYYGALGNGQAYGSKYPQGSTPVAVSGLTNGVSAIAADGSASFAIQYGALYAWGGNIHGQLGTTTPNYTKPALVSGMSSGVTAIAAGAYHALAVQNGAAFAWGYNIEGELGDGTDIDRSLPVAVIGLASGVTAIAAGGSEYYGGHSLAVQNGALYTWGSNSSGVLGRSGSQGIAGVVSGLTSGVTAVAAGAYHSLAVQNGYVYAWGSNASGQLGDGTTTNRFRPVLIDPTDLNSIVAVAAGVQSSFALSTDGSLWVWGTNSNTGVLGLGNTALGRYLTPQHLLPPTGYVFTSIDVDPGYAGNFPVSDTAVVATLAAVPEPSSALLVAVSGLLGTVAMRRKRTRIIAIHVA